MKLDAYVSYDPSLADQDTLTQVLHSCVEVPPFNFDNPRYKVTLVDHPCGFGKTTSLLSVINARPDLKFLVVVNTLDEVARVVSGVDEGRMFAPKDPSEAQANKSEQLEAMLLYPESLNNRRIG